MKHIKVLVCFSILLFGLRVNSQPIEIPRGKNKHSYNPQIDRLPDQADFHKMYKGKLKSISDIKHNPRSPFQYDLRSVDASEADFKNALSELLVSTFDSTTIWPSTLPPGFDPEWVMKLGMNPGLGVKKLHQLGIDGRGIGIAIIDTPILVKHIEYYKNLKRYKENHLLQEDNVASMHGCAVASIAVGKNVGVAPGADLYYFAETDGNYIDNVFVPDLNILANTINDIIILNRHISNAKKIRVISISLGWEKEQLGYERLMKAIESAKKANIFVISSNLRECYFEEFEFQGLGRNPNKNPENPSQYLAGMFWEKQFLNGSHEFDLMKPRRLMFPMDSRTTACPTGVNDYVFYRSGGWSWVIPYLGGLYLLACQVGSKVTPQRFWEIALSTGDMIDIVDGDSRKTLGVIINPQNLIRTLSRHNKSLH